VACKRSSRYVPATDVDHIINKANGGTDKLENLQSLCKKCHRTKTANE
jgi:5-methylcytosine-specific restriction protein A